MKKSLLITFTLLAINLYAQKDLTKKAQPIVDEGKLLYKSEMASWYGTDLFLENYKEREKVGGYLSYTEGDISKCIFFSNSDEPKVIGTISFDNTFNVSETKPDLTERYFSGKENDLYEIRRITLNEINSDTLFKTYKNSNFNLIPLITKKEKKVYVLTGPQQNGVVIFGNDYLLTFDKNNKLLAKKQLHKNIIPIYYDRKEDEGKVIEGTGHSHLPETGDYITATDICTLMLYEKFAKWKTHHVASQKYLNIWNCETDQLNVITIDAVKKISEDTDNKKKKNEEKE